MVDQNASVSAIVKEIAMTHRRDVPRADRIRAVAANGFKAYSYWNATADERKAMIEAQRQTGLKCVSLVGTGAAGGTTGFTKPGAQDALLAEIKERVDIAKEFGTQPDLISFVGIIQPDVPWETQRTQIVDGLKRAGDIAAAGGVTIAVEPLSVNPGQPRRALDRCLEAFPVIKEVNHPNVKSVSTCTTCSAPKGISSSASATACRTS